MKKLRIIISLIIAALMLLCCAACGDFSSSATPDEAGSGAGTPDSAATKDSAQTVDASWFDDAVFLGDSVTLKLSYYCEEYPEALGDAKFFCAGSLGYTSALWELDREDSVHPYYRGKNYLSQDCAKITGAKKVFVMLGMNDIGLYGIDESMKSVETLITNIKKTSPEAKIYIQSVTPIIKGMEKKDLSNKLVRSFNKKLEAFCKENSYPYLDIYGLLADKDGYLPPEYCGDQEAQGIHFTDAACELWVKYLKENVI